MSTHNKISSESLALNTEYFQTFDYTIVTGDFDKKQALIDIYDDKGFFGENLQEWNFDKFLTNLLKSHNLRDSSILATKYKGNTFYIYFNNGTNTSFTLREIQGSVINSATSGEKIEAIEKRASEIHTAIEAIYDNNDSLIWDNEINEEDIVNDELIKKYSLSSDLKGKNLHELKSLLDIENVKLRKIYTITGNTQKHVQTLKTELQYYTGIGDKYEGGARFFSMTTQEIKSKTNPIVNSLSHRSLILYIRDLHKQMDDDIFHGNYKKSDMVKAQNTKVLDTIYKAYFERLKREKASNKLFIELIKVMTGRGEKVSKDGEELEYESLEWDIQFREMQFANTIIIHVMQRPGGIIEEIIRQKNGIDNVELQDEELKGRTPQQIMEETVSAFTEFGKKQGKTAAGLLKDMKLDSLIGINKDYKDLTLDEKVKLGAAARMINVIENITIEEIKEDPNILMSKLEGSMKDSFNDINESLGDNFDGMFGITGKTAKDLGLSGDMAEIFDLYQDINGNLLFDLADDAFFNNITWAGTATFALSIVAAGVAMGMLASGAPILAILAAGATAGAITGLISNVLGKQGYDSFSEGAMDIIATMTADAMLGAFFFFLSVKAFAKFGIDILAEKLMSTKTAIDISLFGGMEVLANAFMVTPGVSEELKKKFLENHFDTDEYYYQNGERIQRPPKEKTEN